MQLLFSFKRLTVNFFAFVENLAYKKKTSCSSEFSWHFTVDRAVDMSDNSLFSSGADTEFNWLRIDLEDSYFIHEVLLFARATCCGSGSALHNFELRIGKSQLYFCKLCSVIWYGMVWYGMVRYGMVWYGMI